MGGTSGTEVPASTKSAKEMQGNLGRPPPQKQNQTAQSLQNLWFLQ